jgi:Arc/MetJ family transcription regulator
MRTSIEIDDRLMQEAMRLSGLRTKKAVVDASLRLLAEMDPRDAREIMQEYEQEKQFRRRQIKA